MNVLDLFSGIGGFSLGLERAGMRTVAFCEIDPYCRAVLRKHWPGVPIFEDVRTLTANDVRSVDLICGGFPCQDISLAGGGAGIEGARSGLWREFSRLIGELRPRFAVVENVAALTIRGLLNVLGDLAALGFDAEWHCIPASAVGARHIRDRVWIVAYPKCDSFQGWALIAAEGCEQSREKQLPRFLFAGIGDAVSAARVWRATHGIPSRLDVRRNMAVGNAVVPQIPEIIGRAIMTSMKVDRGVQET